jgi:hypothetical protein
MFKWLQGTLMDDRGMWLNLLSCCDLLKTWGLRQSNDTRSQHKTWSDIKMGGINGKIYTNHCPGRVVA